MPKGKMPFKFYSYLDNADNYGYNDYCTRHCSSHEIFAFYTNRDIRYVMINDTYIPTIKDLLFQNIVFGCDQTLSMNLTFYQADGQKYANSPIDINMLPIQIPPSLMVYIDESMDDSAKMLAYLNLNVLSSTTDSDGKVQISLNFTYPYYGLYVISFTAGSASTFPVFFKTDFPIGNIEIRRQPKVNTSLPHVADIFQVVPMVYVTNTQGQPMKDVTVTTLFDDGSGCSNNGAMALMDQYTYGCAPNNLLTSYISTKSSFGSKTNYADEFGIVNFTKFNVMDVRGKACVKFKFAIGEPGLVFISMATDEVCIINDYSFGVSSKMSPKIADNQAFGVPPTMTISRTTRGFNDLNGSITIAGYVLSIDNEEQLDKFSSSNRVLKNFFCEFNSR